ncbi:MAG TPA: hypothetical protein VEP66_20995 [Myxococcales bacterium]|nr:hypothetical protein [Myxococcales bacterium]
MSESTTQIEAPSLEQILWRSMDRFAEEPALLDAEEFAAHIAHAFDAHVPEEDFADRFFSGFDRLHEPPTLAEGVVRRAAQRLHAYEFDLNRLEYVIVEDRDHLVVVSEFGQFTLRSEDAVARALEAAVVKRPDRVGVEPRGYLVRKSGDVVGVDVKQVARTLEGLILHQISAPAVEAPARRLVFFNPVRQAMTPAREERALRQDPRLARPAPAVGAPEVQAAPPVLVLQMPDGSLARARIGAASRWERMLGQQARSAARRFSIEAGGVVAVVDGAAPLGAGERALAQGEALAAVRSEAAPVRALGGDELARALVEGAKLVPAVGREDRFWVQPEQAFRPEAAPAAAVRPPVMARPLQLGEMTGDPWADWALTVGEARLATAHRAALDRPEAVTPAPVVANRFAVPDRQALQLAGSPVIAFRALDGTIVLNGAPAMVRLAVSVRPDAPQPVSSGGHAASTSGPSVAVTPPAPGSKAGAVPYPVVQTLQAALERTAAARAYKLRVARRQPLADTVGAPTGSAPLFGSWRAPPPVADQGETQPRVWVRSAPDAIGAGESLQLSALDERRTTVRMAGPVTAPSGTTRFLLSIPFPNHSEMHVGRDLTDALDTWVAAPVATAPAAAVAPSIEWFRAPPLRAPISQNVAPAFDLVAATPLSTGGAGVSGVPFLLRAAVAQGGDATAGQGRLLLASVPATPSFADELELAAASRAPRAGEDEIVIPLPLWAQMGRGAISETAQIMASPVAPAGYAPPLGSYQLVIPGGGPLDLTAGAPPGIAAVEISGPTALNVAPRPSGTVTASTRGGSHFLGRVPVDEPDAPATRGRIRIGAPLQGADVSTLVSGASPLSSPGSPAPSTLAPSSTASLPPARPPAVSSSRSVSVSTPPFSQPVTAQGSQSLVIGGPHVALTPQGGAVVSPTPYPITGAAQAAKPAAGKIPGPASTKEIPVGLPPGMWSSHRVSAPGYRQWSYAAHHRDQPQTLGGLELGGSSHMRRPQLPVALRFRFVGAPLWWSSGTEGLSPGLDREATTATAAAQTGVRAANSAASIWRSILVAGASQENVPGGLVADREASAQAMSSVARQLDASGATLVAPAPPPAPSTSAPAYIAMSPSGAAGTVSASAAARARAEAVEMSIVAAIPPSPPPLESMSSVARGGAETPHARGRGPGHPAQERVKDADEPVSHSKIEGSVDAIAQRIYHRIRRRIQSDRERFGG